MTYQYLAVPWCFGATCTYKDVDDWLDEFIFPGWEQGLEESVGYYSCYTDRTNVASTGIANDNPNESEAYKDPSLIILFVSVGILVFLGTLLDCYCCYKKHQEEQVARFEASQEAHNRIQQE